MNEPRIEWVTDPALTTVPTLVLRFFQREIFIWFDSWRLTTRVVHVDKEGWPVS